MGATRSARDKPDAHATSITQPTAHQPAPQQHSTSPNGQREVLDDARAVQGSTLTHGSAHTSSHTNLSHQTAHAASRTGHRTQSVLHHTRHHKPQDTCAGATWRARQHRCGYRAPECTRVCECAGGACHNDTVCDACTYTGRHTPAGSLEPCPPTSASPSRSRTYRWHNNTGHTTQQVA